MSVTIHKAKPSKKDHTKADERQLSVRLPKHVFQALKQRASEEETTLRALVLDAVVQHYGLEVAPSEKKDRRPEARKLQAQLYQKYKKGEIDPGS
ncbi:hypothetical protein CKO28_18470 [Rhodovibrio sodomensis]|uniref:Ribbon-helix-helix protein CopG domain-containing protein n=1 Tax=Rhodovibrio sodomensis TaxID=1088 RepID=A0ABS1DIV1_9PROT|nr:hypothetical protein [Rhodovibrio sodomensis]MBK1670022.1 hypothetical protein [Rhodovibrio sodomensis]